MIYILHDVLRECGKSRFIEITTVTSFMIIYRFLFDYVSKMLARIHPLYLRGMYVATSGYGGFIEKCSRLITKVLYMGTICFYFLSFTVS